MGMCYTVHVENYIIHRFYNKPMAKWNNIKNGDWLEILLPIII